MRRRPVLTAALVLGLTLSGCGGNTETAGEASSTGSGAAASKAPATGAALTDFTGEVGAEVDAASLLATAVENTKKEKRYAYAHRVGDTKVLHGMIDVVDGAPAAEGLYSGAGDTKVTVVGDTAFIDVEPLASSGEATVPVADLPTELRSRVDVLRHPADGVVKRLPPVTTAVYKGAEDKNGHKQHLFQANLGDVSELKTVSITVDDNFRLLIADYSEKWTTIGNTTFMQYGKPQTVRAPSTTRPSDPAVITTAAAETF